MSYTRRFDLILHTGCPIYEPDRMPDGEAREPDSVHGNHRLRRRAGLGFDRTLTAGVRSGWSDLNRRPPAPKAGALPSCATARTAPFWQKAVTARQSLSGSSAHNEPGIMRLGSLAQLAEQRALNPQVRGSSPRRPTLVHPSAASVWKRLITFPTWNDAASVSWYPLKQEGKNRHRLSRSPTCGGAAPYVWASRR